MVKKAFFYLISFFTVFVILFAAANYYIFKKHQVILKNIISSYQYNFILENKIYDKIDQLKLIAKNYYTFMEKTQKKEKILKLKNDVSKILTILKTLSNLNVKNYKPFLFNYITNEFPEDIEIIKNKTIIISKDFTKIGKKTSILCNPMDNIGVCEVKNKQKFTYIVYSPYYGIIIKSNIPLTVNKTKIQQKILKLFYNVPNIVLLINGKLIKGSFNTDSFYILDEIKPLNLFFGFAVKYKLINELSNKITINIYKNLIKFAIYFAIFYIVFVIMFYLLLFVFFNKKISLLQQAFDEYFIKAHTDKLTNLFNRHGFEQRISDQNCKYFLIIDLDNFKYINDTFGHEMGDYVLKRFSQMLKRHFQNDLIGRWGGDEFLICTNKSKEEINNIFNLINKKITILQKEFDENPKKTLSVSVGVCDNSALPFEKRFTNSDLALYKVKKSKKGNIFFYSDLNYVKIEKEDLNQL